MGGGTTGLGKPGVLSVSVKPPHSHKLGQEAPVWGVCKQRDLTLGAQDHSGLERTALLEKPVGPQTSKQKTAPKGEGSEEAPIPSVHTPPGSPVLRASPTLGSWRPEQGSDRGG